MYCYGLVFLICQPSTFYPFVVKANYSAVVGSMIVVTELTEFAGNPPCFACSRTISSFGAM